MTTVMDARAAWGLAAKLTRDEAVGLELEHDTEPGTVVIAAATVSQDLSHTFHVPLTDPRTLPSGTGGYFWRVEGSRNTLVALKNMTDEPQRYNLIVRHAEGQWVPGLRTLEPRQSLVLDVGLLQAMQEPDAKGETIPMTVSSGQIHWSVGAGRDRRAIVGRIEQVDLVRSVSATYACPQPTNDTYWDSWITPAYRLIEANDVVPFVAWEQDEDAFGGGLEEPYEITDILNWQSLHPDVADIVGFGLVRGLNNGLAFIRATGQSNGWDTYNPAEEDPENHVPIELWADADVQQCPGDATRSAIRQEYVDHQKGHTNFFAGGLPSCADFSSNRQAVYFSFNEINQADYNVALVRAPLIALESAGHGLDKWRSNYGSPRIINSGFRNPVRNTAEGGAPGDSVPGSGKSGSRHMYGDAAGLRNQTAGGGADPNDPEDPANAARL